MPDWAEHVRARLSSLRLSATRENEIVEELSQHLEDRWRELIAGGATPEEATQLTLAEFRGADVLAKYMAPLRQAHVAPSIAPGAPAGRGLTGLSQDLRYGARTLRKQPGFTLVAVLTMAIGIGATTAIFSVVNGILIKPLPFAESDRLIALVHQAPGVNQDELAASPAIYFTYRENNRTFESVALWFSNTASVTGAGDPEEVQRLESTHELLPLLRVTPLVGRTFSEADDQPGSPGTVILSYGYWHRRFGGAAAVVGKTLVVDGAPHEIIGVLPREFRFLQQPAEILTPARPNRALAFVPSIGGRGVARLKDGVTLEQASADVARMIPILINGFPIVPGLTRAGVERMKLGPNLRLLKDDFIGDLDEVLWVLFGTIGMLLLIACANVANLQLARTEVRGHELAIRTALGARWSRIASSLLVESTLLGFMGGIAGLGLTTIALPVLLSAAAQELPGMLEITIDPAVVAFTFAISLGTGLLFGLIPVVKYARPQVAAMLGGIGRSHSPSRGHHRARNSLVVMQVALAAVLLVGSGLMIRTFQSLRNVDTGFTDPDRIQTLHLSMSRDTVPEFDRVIRMQKEISDGLAAIAGVESAAFSSRSLPLIARGPTGPFSLESRPGAAPVEMEFRYASPSLFRTMGTRLVGGRDFQWTDYSSTRQVAIVSETFARREWGSPAAAIGKRMRRSEKNPWLEVVGVAGDVRYRGLERPAPDTVYLTSSEALAPFMSRDAYFLVRSERVGTAGFIDDLQRAIWSVNGSVPLGSVQTMGEVYRRSTARTSLTLVLLSITAAMALALGLIGIYGVISYMLTQRTREIGVRMALGARTAALKRMVLGQVLLLVAVGVALGLGGAAVLTRLMESLLFGVGPLDVFTYVTVSAILVVASALAAYLPVRRVTRIDPLQALRAE
ncbi:MAG TPA: ABC transporter permease [Vicinamibacterales bacterium]|nr:ABC transporter permease [Vicinamibacterales bacterium]